jgi:hypothetical protein
MVLEKDIIDEVQKWQYALDILIDWKRWDGQGKY